MAGLVMSPVVVQVEKIYACVWIVGWCLVVRIYVCVCVYLVIFFPQCVAIVYKGEWLHTKRLGTSFVP